MHSLSLLKIYFIPMTETRQLVFDADRLFHLGRIREAKHKLAQAEDFMRRVGEAEDHSLRKPAKELILLLDALLLTIDQAPADTREKFQLLGDRLNLMLLKGDLVLRGAGITESKLMFGFRRDRRKRLRSRPFPKEWSAVLQKNVPFYRLLDGRDRTELHGHTFVLLAEKHFEGCDGLILTDQINTTIAAQAGILLLHCKPGYYPHLRSIVVYPHAYLARRARVHAAKVVHEATEVRNGEAWSLGTVVLSWEDIEAVASRAHGYRNVVLHEFAYQLDMENSGVADGHRCCRDVPCAPRGPAS